MSQKHKDLKPTPYWESQREALLKHNPKNLVTPTGAPLPPNSTHEQPKLFLDELFGLGQQLQQVVALRKLLDKLPDRDVVSSWEFIKQLRALTPESPEDWYEPPEAQ